MPKITDAQYVTDTNGTGYIIGYQDGVFCRWPVTMAVANKWLSGSGVPNVGTGVDDDYYLDLDTGDVYQKVDGSWGTALTNIYGADGADGTDGIDGADGATWHFGSGVPSSDLGSDDDGYMDTLLFYIYKKVAGAWISLGCIKGSDGSSSGCPDYILQNMGVI